MNSQPLRDEDQPTMDALESPGKRLRIARQAKGLSQSDAASQLHLGVAMVKALESDDHDRLPGPVFVRGYIRNYARLLELDEAELLSTFERALPDDLHKPPAVRVGAPKEIRPAPRGARLLSWVFLLCLGGLLFAWWQGHLDWIVETPRHAIAPTEPPASVAEDDSLLLPEPEPELAREPEVIPPVPPPAPLPPSQELESPPAAPEAVLPESVTALATAEEDTPEAPPEAIAEEPSASVLPGPADDAQPEQPPTDAVPDTAGKVVFEFLGPCWVDVRDSTRKFKLFGEMRKGDRRVLEGTPPYSVILGNSPMVKVSVDGKPYDIEAHSRGNVARFTLDPGELN
jgi:cytoskeleton protein RodZ